MNANVNENVLVDGVNNNVENTAKVEKKKKQIKRITLKIKSHECKCK
jgi:hypothetical protein